MTDEMTPKQELLYAMGKISEDQWCAGWYSGLEYVLWDLVTNRRDTVGHMTKREAKHIGDYLEELADEAGGWWAWQDDGNHGAAFIEIADWKKMVADTAKKES